MTAERMTFALQILFGFGTLISILAICATIVSVSAFRRTQSGAAKTLSLMARRAGILQLVTVLVLVIALLLLRILDLIESAATVSALTGIAGFVLGGLAKGKSEDASALKAAEAET